MLSLKQCLQDIIDKFTALATSISTGTITTTGNISTSGNYHTTGNYYKDGYNITKVYSLTLTGTVKASDGASLTGTFTMPSPYRIVTGVRQISNNHPNACHITRYLVDGDGASGNTVTVTVNFYNITSSTNYSVSSTVELGLSV